MADKPTPGSAALSTPEWRPTPKWKLWRRGRLGVVIAVLRGHSVVYRIEARGGTFHTGATCHWTECSFDLNSWPAGVNILSVGSRSDA